MPNIFNDLLRSTAMDIASKAKDATSWYQNSIENINKKEKRTDPNKIFTNTSSPEIGSMYLFVYDAKHKATLPFYDMYPLAFPIEMYRDGFLGINLHYLPPMARVSLMKALVDIRNNNKYNQTTKLNISYELLSRYSNQFKGVNNCIKRYLFAHVRSGFKYVNPSDWEKAALLPLQRWSIDRKSTRLNSSHT